MSNGIEWSGPPEDDQATGKSDIVTTHGNQDLLVQGLINQCIHAKWSDS
jgi:hypothetical protein